jgi:hypothetical protein
MDINNKEIKEIRKFESVINRNLYFFCSLLTLLTMATLLVEFFSRGDFPNFKIDIFYLGVLILYSAHKELIRLLGKKNFWHSGEYFVYAWVAITMGLYVVDFLTKGYYTANQRDTVLMDATLITLEVMAVFIISRLFKLARAVYEIKHKN